MTVASQASRITYPGPQSTPALTIPFQFNLATDLIATQMDSSGTVRTLALGTDYTVTGAGLPSGGILTTLAGNLPAGYLLTVRRAPALLQGTSLQNQGAFYLAAIEAALDALDFNDQSLGDQVARAITAPEIDGVASVMVLPPKLKRAGTLLGFDVAGNVTTTAQTVALTTLTNVANVAALRLVAAPALNGAVYATGGYYAVGDIGASIYIWNSTDVRADNSGSIIQITGVPTGRFNLQATSVLFAAQFGAKGDGINDDTAAILAGIAALSSGGTLRLRTGTYKVTGEVVLNANGVSLVGDGVGNTIIKQYTANKAAVRVSQSFCLVQGMSLVPNLTTGVTGLRVAPVNEADTTTLGYINYNMFRDVEIESSDEGVYMAPGPDVGGTDSQCFYNTFINVRTRYCKRGLYMADGPNASSAGVNRNSFFSCRFAEQGNTGIHIRNGGTNQFFSCHAEGLTTGVTPSATPVGFRIEALGTYSGANAENCFYGCVAEGCTWEWQNDAIRTNLFGGSVQVNHGSSAFEVQIGSRDLTSAQSQPLRINAALYAQHLSENAALPNDTTVIPIGGGLCLAYSGALRPETFDAGGGQQYKWAAYNVAPQMTNVTSIGAQFSQWYVFGGFAEWHLRVSFRATVAATPVTINLPTAPDATFLGGAMSNFVGHAYITNGANAQLQYMPLIAGPAVSLTHPSNWNIASNVNEIHFIYRFRISR